MYKVLVACTYSINRGDELLLGSLEHAVRSRLGEVEFSRTVLNSASRGGVDALNQPLGLLMKISVLFGLRFGSIGAKSIVPILMWWIEFSSRLDQRIVNFIEPRSWNKIRKAARESDVCVASAGGYLLAEARDEWLWLSHLLTLQLIKSSGCSVVGAPCSIGPFNPTWDKFVNKIPESFDYIYVRDDSSLTFLRDISAGRSVRPEVVRSVDLGFAHPWRSDNSNVGSNSISDPISIGVSARFYRFGGGEDEQKLRESFESSLTQVLNRLVSNYDCSITFFSQNEGGYSDVEYAKALSVRLVDEVNIVESRVPIEDLVLMYGGLNALIGVRMHACIMALSMGTPVVPIAYEPKTYGAMGDFDADLEVFDIRNIDAEELYSAVRNIIENVGAERYEIKNKASVAAKLAIGFCDSVSYVALQKRGSKTKDNF
ncbi:polysaccharide pyruvyl transferase family protein [Rhodococcus globerulus]|uniref:polysaccharide pyruvyl transferase family protein n=1 Tax=Rhodococcus globerulus TaxID=33008 RepID=UPI000AB1136B|nr:polysaccharide pyruvyl transferase family protein [Rhodococcus globerulus]